MVSRALLCLLVFALVAASAGLAVFAYLRFATNAEEAIIKTTSGPVKGKTFAYDGKNYPVFLGIKYGTAKRFQKPQPISWKDVYEATKFGAVCAQHQHTKESAKYGMEEDCLTLNIFTPPIIKPVEKYPVLFWIHGGYLHRGTSARLSESGIVHNLVSKGIIVVTVSYRLGFLGFFTTLTKEFPPNLGTHDQLQALEWVRDNIEKFGGDPAKITVGGGSAGGCSTSALSVSPKVPANYFRGAIMSSGVAEICWDGDSFHHKLNEERAKRFCNINLTMPADEATNAALKQCLQSIDHSVLSEPEKTNLVGWGIVVDGDLFPNVPSVLLKTAPIRPAMISVTSEECAKIGLPPFLVNVSVAIEIKDQVSKFPQNKKGMEMVLQPKGVKNELIEKIFETFDEFEASQTSPNNETFTKALSAALSAAIFEGRAALEAKRLVDHGNKRVYLYEYADGSYGPMSNTSWPAAHHTLDRMKLFWEQYNPVNEKPRKNLQVEMIVNFVKTLNPGMNSEPLNTKTWPYTKIGPAKLEHLEGFKESTRKRFFPLLEKYPEPFDAKKVDQRFMLAKAYV